MTQPTLMAELITSSFYALLPELLLLVAAVAMMTAGAFVSAPRSTWFGAAFAANLAAIVVLFLVWNAKTDPYASVVSVDAMSNYARLLFLVTGLILLAMAHDQVIDQRGAEFFGALLLITAGSMLVASANELVFLFLGLELVSIPTYLLLYLPRRTHSTQEATTKYFYLSVFSAGLLLFGLAYIYGLTGVSNLKALAFLLNKDSGRLLTQDNLLFGAIAIVFVMAGLGFRVAAVPFHFYAPDVYQGAPTIVTAMLAWVPKGIGFLAMIRVLTSVFSVGNDLLAQKAYIIAWVIALATMIVGNTVALLQTDLKRLLAYSSIAHAGYLMIGIAAAFNHQANPNSLGVYLGAESIVFYLVAYSFMTLGVFAVLLALNTNAERPVETIDDLAGLGQVHPLLGLSLAVCLFSLAGIPPLAGFWGKFFIFASAWKTEPAGTQALSLKLLAILGAINAAIGAYYYLRIVVAIYLRPATESRLRVSSVPLPTLAAAVLCAVLSVFIGLRPGPVQKASRLAAVEAISQPEPILEKTTPPATAVSAATAAVPGSIAQANPGR